MPQQGYIRDKVDIKVLVLYLTARTAAPIDLAALTDLSMCDDGVDYFSFAQAVGELVESGHLLLEQGRYCITEKGRKNGAALEESLPFSVRQRCDQNLAQINIRLRQEAQIRAEISPRPDSSGFTVRMALDDNDGNLMTLELYAPTEAQATQLAASYRTQPERFYRTLLTALSQGKTTAP